MTAKAFEEPHLSTLLARLDELRQAERRAAAARMISVVGHLVGTPLNVITGRAALIRTNTSPEAVEENVRRIEEQVERLAQRIRRLIEYFALAEPQTGLRSIGDVLKECEQLYAPIAAEKGVLLQVSGEGLEALKVDGLTPVVLTTLLSLGVRTTNAGDAVRLEVVARGPETVAFEFSLPGVEQPPKSFERLEPPEPGVRYDAGILETFWVCLGLARRSGGGLEVVRAPSGVGVTARFQCAHR